MFRKYIISGVTVFIALALFSAFGVRNAASNVAGGYHDLSMNGGGVSGGGFTYLGVMEPCIFCHTPHNANKNETYSSDPTVGGNAGALNGQFLWNRRLPSQAFQVYSSPTLPVAVNQPGAASLLCLSCHDGIGGMNVLLHYPDGMSSIPPNGFGSGNADQFGDFPDPLIAALNIGDASCTGDNCTGGTNLQNDHPIGFSYTTAQTADPTGLKVITNTALQTRLAITGGMVECNTCHDPHITNTTHNNFLVVTNTGSQLCLECHNK